MRARFLGGGEGMNERTMLLPGVDAFGDLSGSFQRTSRLSSATVAAGIPPLHIPSKFPSSQSISFLPIKKYVDQQRRILRLCHGIIISLFLCAARLCLGLRLCFSLGLRLAVSVSSSQSQSPFTSKRLFCSSVRCKHWRRYIRSTFYKHWQSVLFKIWYKS